MTIVIDDNRDFKIYDADVNQSVTSNMTLQYRNNFFAIITSRSRRTMWTKYPKNKLVRAVSE